MVYYTSWLQTTISNWSLQSNEKQQTMQNCFWYHIHNIIFLLPRTKLYITIRWDLKMANPVVLPDCTSCHCGWGGWKWSKLGEILLNVRIRRDRSGRLFFGWWREIKGRAAGAFVGGKVKFVKELGNGCRYRLFTFGANVSFSGGVELDLEVINTGL